MFLAKSCLLSFALLCLVQLTFFTGKTNGDPGSDSDSSDSNSGLSTVLKLLILNQAGAYNRFPSNGYLHNNNYRPNNVLYNNLLYNSGLYSNGLYSNLIYNNLLYNNGLHNNGLYNNGLYNNGLYNNYRHSNYNNRCRNWIGGYGCGKFASCLLGKRCTCIKGHYRKGNSCVAWRK